MIKVKDGYAKLIGTTYQGSATQVLLSNGGDLEYSASSKASTLVQRNASQHIYATYFNSAISDEALTDIGSVYVRNTSDTFIRRVSKTQFYSILDNKFVTLDTTQSITGAKTFSTSVRFVSNASIIQNQNDTSNYTTILKWYKNGASRNTYDPSIGQHNTGGDGNGSICILPYPTATSPWGGTVGLFISKGVLKLDGKSVALAENYYTKTESDERYVNVTGDTMTGPLIVKAAITGTQLISTIATGTSPLKVTSTTVVTNLNSDLLDGLHETSFFRARGDQSIASSVPTTTELATSNNLCGSWNVKYTGASGHLVQFNAGSGSTRYMQFYSTYSGSLYWRNSTDSTLNTKSWKTIVDSANYTGIVLKIGTATKGSATLPIYLNAGTPTACSTTLGVSITGNAATATKLQTARTINGTSFDGTANIVTAYWGTARTISLSGAVTGSASVNGSQNVTITTAYQFGSIDGRYVGGNKTANHGSSGTAYTANTYSSTFVNKAFVAFAERGSWAYANNGYVSTDTGVNIPLAGTAIFQWGASDTNKTQLYITPHNNSGVSNPAANEMLFYTSNGSGYTSAWTRVLTHRNYTNYTVTKTGGGASGTWGISITGNAATATKLQTARTINGTSFDGTANIVTAYWGTARTISLSGAVTGSASVNGSQNVTITTAYQFGSIDGRYVGGNKTANHGSSGTAYTANTYSSTFVNKAFVAFAERGSWAYANNGYVSTDTGVNIPLAGTAIFQWGASDTNKTQLYITPHNNSGVSNPAANEMLFYTSNGSGYTSAWTRVLTHRNYTNYTVTKTGGGASGTWGISITGNAPWANITGKPTLLTLAGITSLTNKDLNYARYNFGTTNKGDDSTQLNVPANYGLYLSLAYSDKNQGGQIFFNTVPGTTGTLYFRTRNAGDGNTVNTWKSWKTVLDSTNYTAYFNPTNYYWANIKVSASSSTATQPTFNTCYTSNWFRSQGSTGWFNQSYSGGIYMNENYWVKTYGGTMMYIAPNAHAWGIGGPNIAMKLYHSSHIGINFATSAYTWGIYANSNGNMYIGRRSGNVNDGSGTYYHTLTASYISSPGFYHSAIGSNSYVLLAGGSYKGLGDFAKGNAGSATKGVYVTGGTVTAMTYSLNANLNSGTAGKLAYYSSATTVASYGSTVGASNRGIYLNAGTPTAMTYYLNATVNAGTSSKLAYYSGANSIDDYTSTVGSSTTPMYLSGGVPTVCSGVVIKYWAIYTINSINSTVTLTKNAGNYSFLTSITRTRDNGNGAYCVYCKYPSGYSWSNTIIWGSGSHASGVTIPSINGTLYVSTSSGGNNYFYVRTADDASTNNGQFRLFMIWF